MDKRSKVYLSDWTDGFKNFNKVIPAILFLYFACLSPAISFGTIASQITNNNMGVVEFLLSAGTSGMVCQSVVTYVLLVLEECSPSIDQGLCGVMRSTYGLHSPNWPNACFHFGTLSFLYIKSTPFLSNLLLGWVVDQSFLHTVGSWRIQHFHSILHTLYR